MGDYDFLIDDSISLIRILGLFLSNAHIKNIMPLPFFHLFRLFSLHCTEIDQDSGFSR